MKSAVESQARQRALRATDGEPRRKFLAAGGRRLAVVFAVLMLTVVPALTSSLGGRVQAEAQTMPPGSIWAIERVRSAGVPIPTFGLEILTSTTRRFGPGSLITKFTARYVRTPTPGINTTSNTSKFTGEITVREGEAIPIRQSFDVTGYVAFHSGLKVLGTNEYKGRYYDNAGEAGDFALRRIR